VTSDNKPETKSRKPRAFAIGGDSDGNQNAGKPGTVKSVSQTAKKPNAARKPRAVKAKNNFREIPLEAAQRFDNDLQSKGDIGSLLTPPPPSAEQVAAKQRRFGWSSLFFSCLAALVALGFGLWIDQLIADLFAKQIWLGWVATALTALLALAALVLVGREVWGLSRMAKIDRLQQRAARVIETNDLKSARQLSAQLIDIYSGRPDTARGRAALSEHRDHIIDGRDIVGLAERDLIKPLDDQARRLVMDSAKKVSVVTAVSPRAVLDIAFVLYENMRLIRRLADLYGGRPGTLGLLRLTRNVVGHLAVTGSIAVGEGLIQQIVGQGLAAKLSSRLGEGVINGLLTARIGIAAIDICRPLPFTAQSRLSVRDFVGEITRFGEKPSANGDK